MGQKKKLCGGISAVFGLALISIGISLKWSIFPTVLEKLVYENVQITKGTEGYDAFVSKIEKKFNFHR